MPLKLSIIIPCYNCEQTLREAVDSCYTQNLNTVSFEIIMVDDGSKDGTRELMKLLATEHDNIHLFYHEHNKGGGAARNTGIRNSQGKIIYCLDSDNVFVANSVQPMLDYIMETAVDGVAFYERRFFFGTNLQRYTTHLNTILDRNITLFDLFNDSNTLLDNFFYTRESYDKTAGYPEHHGFDTQCFEMRYLSAGNLVRVVPQSIFLHRQGTNEPSYFERVHASGLFSVNFMLIFEDIFHLFTPAVQYELIKFPLFRQTKSYGTNALNFIKQKVTQGEEIFRPDYKSLLTPHSLKIFSEEQPSLDTEPSLVQTLCKLQSQSYLEANDLLTNYIKKTKIITPYLIFLSLRINHGIAGIPYPQLAKETLSKFNELLIHSHTQSGGILGTWLRKNSFLRYIKQIVKKYL